MKLVIIFTLVSFLQVSAEGFGQTVTLAVKNAPIEKVFKEVKKQTGFSFVYTREQLKHSLPVTIDVVQAELKSVLAICFRNQPLSFVLEGNYVVVQTKQVALLPSPQQDSLVEIRGRVLNENGEPLAGASILAKSSGKGISTNSRGEFVLPAVKEDDVLIISNVGFYREEIAVSKQRFFLITLKPAINSLEETVVKGYYSTSRRLNTGSVVKINGTQITNQPISNPMLGLAGLVPGLLVTQNNGLPGSRFKALIRGQNSIQNGNSPLYIIDGVPFLSDNDALTQLNGMLANSPFNSIDPNDIESVEILKDADATSIYGSRGANGVILITTKRNKAEKNSLSVNISRGWGKVTRTMPLMNTQQYIEMRKEAFLNDGVTPTINNAPDLVAWDQTRYTNWKKEFIGGSATTFNAQLRYSGGNQFTKFSLGTGYYDEKTVFPGSYGDKKNTADINLSHKSRDSKMNLTFISSYGNNRNLLPGQDLTSFITLPPNSYALIDSSGKYVWREGGYSVGNPLASLQQTTNVVTDRLTANSIFGYKPIRNLELKLNLGYNKVEVSEKILSPMNAQDPAYAPKGTSVLGDNFIKTWVIEPQVTYNFHLDSNLIIEALAGTTWQKTEAERKLVTGTGYTNDGLLGSIAAAPFLTATNSNVRYNYAAIFGRIGINWDSKYILNITGRRDGSSRFGPDKRFANFAAAGVAWIFSKEPFVRETLPFLSFGKARGSYGLTGNDQIGNYQYLDTYRGTVYAYNNQPGLMPARLFNSDYSWEENKKLELAVELGFFEDKLSVNVNYYKNSSENQIIRYSLPTQTGFADVLLNFPGIVQNKGYEALVNADIFKTKHFRWNTSFNISHNKNRLVAFPGLANSSYASNYIIGKPLNVYRGLRFLGLDVQKGIYQFEDINKDGIISNADFEYIGTTDPKYFGGFSNSFSFRKFQLNILLEFRKQLGRDAVYSSPALGDIVNQSTLGVHRWRKAGDLLPYQRYTQEFTNPAYVASTRMSSSDAALTDASYIRLRNVALSYNFSGAWLKNIHAIKGNVFFNIQNLVTITKYTGHDPESQSLSSLPPLRMSTAGIQLNF